MITDIDTKSGEMILPIHVNSKGRYAEVDFGVVSGNFNLVSSAYGRKTKFLIEDAIKNDGVLFQNSDKKRVETLLARNGVQFPTPLKLSDSIINISENRKNVNRKFSEKFSLDENEDVVNKYNQVLAENEYLRELNTILREEMHKTPTCAECGATKTVPLYKCLHCDKVFEGNDAYNEHLGYVRTLCPYCGENHDKYLEYMTFAKLKCFLTRLFKLNFYLLATETNLNTFQLSGFSLTCVLPESVFSTSAYVGATFIGFNSVFTAYKSEFVSSICSLSIIFPNERISIFKTQSSFISRFIQNTVTLLSSFNTHAESI